MNNVTIEELENDTLLSGVEIELVFDANIDYDEEFYSNHRNQYINPLYRHCDIGGD